MTARTEHTQRHTLVTVCISPSWHSTVRRAIDALLAKNPRMTESQALDQVLVQGAISIDRQAMREAAR